MLTATQFLAILASTVFAGAAIYISLVEHPARMSCDTRTAATVCGAVLIGSVVPFTLIIIKRTNDRLLAPGRDLGSSDTRALLEKWGKLHAVRSLLSVLASVIFVYLVLKG